MKTNPHPDLSSTETNSDDFDAFLHHLIEGACADGPVVVPTAVPDSSAIRSPATGQRKDFKAMARRLAGSQASGSPRVDFRLEREDYEIPDDVLRGVPSIAGSGDVVLVLQRIVSAIEKSAMPLDGYLSNRVAWLTAQFALNVEGLLAPLYRPSLTPVRFATTQEHATFSADRQVIDLHWLHQSGQRLTVYQKEFARLFGNGPFNFELAEDFALTNVKTTVKVNKWLALCPEDQWTTACLHSDETRRALQAIRGSGAGTTGEPGIVQILHSVHRGRPDVVERIAIDVCHWKAAQMLPDGTASARAQLFACMRRAKPSAPHHFRSREKAALDRINTVLITRARATTPHATLAHAPIASTLFPLPSSS